MCIHYYLFVTNIPIIVQQKIEDSEFRINPNWQLLPKNKDSQFKLPNNVGIAPEVS